VVGVGLSFLQETPIDNMITPNNKLLIFFIIFFFFFIEINWG
jgi:hypothetical protein